LELKVRIVFDKNGLEETLMLLRELSGRTGSAKDIGSASAASNLDEIIGLVELVGGIQSIQNPWNLVKLKSAMVAAPVTRKMETLVGLEPSDLLREIVATSRSRTREMNYSI
jgi:hypothetical protein